MDHLKLVEEYDLNDRQAKFVMYYMADEEHNATRAYIKAGYSEKGAERGACKLLRIANVSRAISDWRAQISKELEWSPARMVKEASEVLERCKQAKPVMIFNSATRELEPSGEYQFDSKGANGALKIIGDTIGAFQRRIELDVAEGVSIKLRRDG